ncbi:CAP-Gly domain-containing linker protein 3, partial [Geodia barretti]
FSLLRSLTHFSLSSLPPGLLPQVLRRGANINDRDGLTDLSLLHFACKSGAAGVGNIDAAVNLVNSLLNKGADSELRCKWTNMNALHYAVFFDVPEIVDTLLEHKPSLLHTTCDEFDGGTALHIAASNVSIRATQILLQHGANCKVTDRNGHAPIDVVPSNRTEESEGDVTNQMIALLQSAAEAMEMKEREAQVAADAKVEEGEREEGGEEDKENAMEIEPAVMVEKETPRKSHPPQGRPPHSPAQSKPHSTTASLSVRKTHSPRTTTTATTRDPVRTRGTRSPVSTVSTVSSASSRAVSPAAANEVTMETLGLKIGDRVLIDAKSSANKSKSGTVRFGGAIDFLGGQWAGIELDEAVGKNDGSLKGIRFFTCKPKFGLFVPMQRISKAPMRQLSTERRKKMAANGGRKRESVALSPRTFEAQGTMAVTTDLQVHFSLFFLLLLPDIWASVSCRSIAKAP